MMPEAVASGEKKLAVKETVGLLDKYPIVGLVDMESLPARNLAALRKKLRGAVELRMLKKRLMRLAFKQSEKDSLDKLEEHFTGMPALLFTEDNPFTLFKTLKKNQSPAPIKPGQIAPKDLVVPAGPTPFAPGPIISELGQLGIKSGVQEGKVVIQKDAKLAKKGEEVGEQAASFLARMGIEPMRVGLKLVAVWENGDILAADVLDIDEEKFMQDLQGAHAAAVNFSFNTALPTADTIELLLTKAYNDAISLAESQDIITSDTVGKMLAKASLHAGSLQSALPEVPAEKEEADAAEESEEEKPSAEENDAPQPEDAEKQAEQGSEAPEKEPANAGGAEEKGTVPETSEETKDDAEVGEQEEGSGRKEDDPEPEKQAAQDAQAEESQGEGEPDDAPEESEKQDSQEKPEEQESQSSQDDNQESSDSKAKEA